MSNITHGKDGVAVIGIDCHPGTPRPDTYIEQVVSHLGITEIPEANSKNFGAWTWRFSGISEEKWIEGKGAVIQECKNLYASGKIRGAQHYWDSAIEDYINSKITIETLMLKNVTPQHLYEAFSTEEERTKFVEDFEFAKNIVDQLFTTYEERQTLAQ